MYSTKWRANESEKREETKTIFFKNKEKNRER